MIGGSDMSTEKEKPDVSITPLPDGRLTAMARYSNGREARLVEQPTGVVHLAFNAASTEGKGGIEGDAGLAPSESASALKDREVNLILQRDDTGAEQAYDNCPSFYNSVDRYVSAVNSGLIVYSEEQEKFKEVINAIVRDLARLETHQHINTKLIHRILYGVGAFGISVEDNDIHSLIPIDTKLDSFKLIVDSTTGKLGGKAGEGLDPDDKEKIVVAVQKGYTVQYSHTGQQTSKEEKYTYFSEDGIVILGNYVRGRFRGTPEGHRVIRSVENLLRAQNTLQLLIRRPSQVYYIIGNETNNLNNADIPKSYIDDATDNDPVQARRNWKADMLEDFATEAKKMVEGNVLYQCLEWGVEPVTLKSDSEKVDYVKVCDYWDGEIKKAILTLETRTNRVVTSGKMEENIDASLVRKARMEQKIIEDLLNQTLIKKLLEFKHPEALDQDGNPLVRVKFNPITEQDPKDEIELELMKAQVLKTFKESNYSPPEKIIQEWGVQEKQTEIELNKALLETQDNGFNKMDEKLKVLVGLVNEQNKTYKSLTKTIINDARNFMTALDKSVEKTNKENKQEFNQIASNIETTLNNELKENHLTTEQIIKLNDKIIDAVDPMIDIVNSLQINNKETSKQINQLQSNETKLKNQFKELQEENKELHDRVSKYDGVVKEHTDEVNKIREIKNRLFEKLRPKK